ncbi:MAG: serine/threonine protein kinase [Gemmatimonadaceae bacterium]|nr:serine/threonine protein kinase [Gemmatimonadaceae bacterium]
MTDRAPEPRANLARDVARSRRAAVIVDDALDIDVAEREAFIQSACAKDALLLADVRQWLDAAEAPSAVVDRVSLTAPARALFDVSADDITLEPDARVGSWRIVQQIGHGGMGIVYEAARDDGTFDRRVAIKVARQRPSDPAVVRQFDRERKLLASLEHPGIARLVDAGLTPDGLPFYAMELVEGEPIDVWCDRMRLDVRARVALIRQVCSAVAHAHAQMVVHCDLKPSNILVTTDGTVKLLDFGIARLMRHGDVAAHRERVAPFGESSTTLDALLTPDYASPEQFRGEAPTAASDVYSLTAVMTRLLAGAPPRSGDGTRITSLPTTERSEYALLANATESAAAACGTTLDRHRRALAGDLEAIVRRGLARDPLQRYRSIDALDRDLSAYLACLPVDARAEGWVVRTTKFMRRRRLPLTFGALAVAGLVAVTGVALRQAQLARRETQHSSAINGLLLDLLALPYPYESSTSRQQAFRRLLDSARTRVDAITTNADGRGTDVLLAMARGYEGLGDKRTAAVLAQRALSVRATLSSSLSSETLAARILLADYLPVGGGDRAAIAQLDTALIIARRTEGPRSETVGLLMQSRARKLLAVGDLAGAEQGELEVLAHFQSLKVSDVVPTAHALQVLGQVHHAQARYSDAERRYRESLAMRIRMRGNAVEIANVEGDLARTLLAMERIAEAEPLALASRGRKIEMLGVFDPEVADDDVLLAALALRRQQLGQAESYARGAVLVYDSLRIAGARHAEGLIMLARVALARGDTTSGRLHVQRALALLARDGARAGPQLDTLRRVLNGRE